MRKQKKSLLKVFHLPEMITKRFLMCFVHLVLFFLFFTGHVNSQNIYQTGKYQYLSFGKIPTWCGVAEIRKNGEMEIHLYDSEKYHGHGDFISKGLKTGLNFKQIKELIRSYETRKYLPFFLFDLRQLSVTENNVTYEWAVRIEDYAYTDTDAQMLETVKNFLLSINTYIKKESGKETRGIIILSKNPKVKPGIGLADDINPACLSKTLSELINMAGAEKIKILNPPACAGYLRYVKSGTEDSLLFSFGDIVIFESTPARIPLVNGIITLEPQTPLSHVNLLALNRGTFNMYVSDLDFIPGADTLIDKPVKIEYLDEKLRINQVSESFLHEFHSKQKPAVVQIPEADCSLRLIVDLNEISKVNITGAKAYNYSIIRKNFPGHVRKAHAIPFYWYFNIINNKEIKDSVDYLCDKVKILDPIRKSDLLRNIRNMIENSEISDSLITMVSNLLKKEYADRNVRLRSSTNCEDLPDFNGAGLYLSTGTSENDSPEKIAKKILKVYASFWTFQAFEERQYFGIDHRKAGMAVLINESFSNEYANGVVITIPGQNDYSILINSQPGENSVTNPETGDVPEAILYLNHGDEKYNIETESNIGKVFLDGNLEEILAQLKKNVTEINNLLLSDLPAGKKNNYGVDVEFKIEREGQGFVLYIKQARLLNSVLPY